MEFGGITQGARALYARDKSDWSEGSKLWAGIEASFQAEPHTPAVPSEDEADWVSQREAVEILQTEGLIDPDKTEKDVFGNAATSKWMASALHPNRYSQTAPDKRIHLSKFRDLWIKRHGVESGSAPKKEPPRHTSKSVFSISRG